MTTKSELREAIAAIEAVAGKHHKAPKVAVRLGSHRWAQVLRILKFYQLRWDELERDPIWDWRQDHQASPYFIKGRSDTPEWRNRLMRYYRDNPDRCIEPPA